MRFDPNHVEQNQMMTTRISVAVLVCCLAVVVSRVSAQQKNEEIKKKDFLSSQALLLQEPTGEGRAASGPLPSVNVGGLVIVEIHDSGSRPPQDMEVKVSRAFERLGQLRGIAMSKGKPLMGGGHTWFLYKPVNASEVENIEVSYTPNDGGKPRKYTVPIAITSVK